LLALRAVADDIDGVQPAALDQPRVNLVVRRSAAGEVLMGKSQGEVGFNVEAFLDTGASSIAISANTASLLGIKREDAGKVEARFQDVGVGGGSQFAISEPVFFSIAPMAPNVNVEDKDAIAMSYAVTTGPFRTEIGPLDSGADFLTQLATGDLDILGMPAIAGKIIVLDPRDVNNMTDKIRTYVYDAKKAAAEHVVIPATPVKVKLTYVSFRRFTKTSAGAEPPSIARNPMIGPDPFGAGDRTPGLVASHGGKSVSGTWLLDTGAAASMISRANAAKLGITYVAGTDGTDHPKLAGVDEKKQFIMTVGGIGGSKKSAGFYLDRLSVPTIGGPPVVFDHAPVLVADISVKDVGGRDDVGKTYTLDGVFGMNFLVASAMVNEGSLVPDIGQLTPGAFKSIVINEPEGWLGLARN
jgi:hypothetical protein